MAAGERLIAERGASVPSADIVEAAGQRNRSAMQYHFGSREALIVAILERRLRELADRQVELLSEHEVSGAQDSVPALLEILVRPMFEVPYADGSTHYARFLSQVRHLAVVSEPLQDATRWPVVNIVSHRIAAQIGHLTPPTRRRRMEALTTVMAGLLADLEQRGQQDGTEMDRSESTVLGTIAMIAGMLAAPEPTV